MTLYLGKQQVAMTMNHVDESAVAQKVDKVTIPNIVYGTDSNGDQTTYNKNSFGQVDDVQVNGTSVVNNKVASITLGTMASENTTSYYTKTEVNGELDAKQDTLVSGTNIKTVDGKSLLGSGNLDIDDLSNNITNCITEIPQDIKLELNNGTLTLKAGSKVYVPNGSNSGGLFDEVTIASDVSRSDTMTANEKRIFAYRNDGSITYTEFTGSGTSADSSFSGFYYNTTNNVINVYSSGTADSRKLSFPICIVSADSNGVMSSIDQVFNGFGYIGSTVFALPGVKGLIPNGRNADGTLKNIEVIVQNIVTYERNLSQTDVPLWLQSDGSLVFSRGLSYDEELNLVITTNTGNPGSLRKGQVLIADLSSGVISNFTPKTAFHALDYNDSPTISGWGIPDYTSEVSVAEGGLPSTAPYNMMIYYYCSGPSTNVNFYVEINGVKIWQGSYGGNVSLCVYASKGDTLASGRTGGVFNKLAYYKLKGAS